MKTKNTSKRAGVLAALAKIFWLTTFFLCAQAFVYLLISRLIEHGLSLEHCNETLPCRMLGVELQQLGDTLRYFCTIVITLAVTWTYGIIYDVTVAGRRKYADAGTCLLRLFLRTWATVSLVVFVDLFVHGAPQKPSSVALCLIIELAGSFACGLFVAISFDLFFSNMIYNAFERIYEKAAEAEKEKKQEIYSALKAVMSEDQ